MGRGFDGAAAHFRPSIESRNPRVDRMEVQHESDPEGLHAIGRLAGDDDHTGRKRMKEKKASPKPMGQKKFR